MVQRLGSPLISTATLKMTALLALGVTAMLGGPSLYAQFVAPKIEAAQADDDQGVWKLPPPPRYLLDSAGTSTEDKTASVPKPALASASKAETVHLRPTEAGLPAPPAAPPPAVAALGASDAPGTLPQLPPSALAPPIVPSSPAVQAEPQQARSTPVAPPLPRPALRAASGSVPHLHTATINPSESERPTPSKAAAAKPAAASRTAAQLPVPRPTAAKTATAHAETKASKSRPGPHLAQTKPAAPARLAEAAPQAAAPPPQSQRIPVLSNILDGINSAGQAITNAVPKF